MDTSPVGWAAFIVALVGAFIAVLSAAGLPVSPELEDAIKNLFLIGSPAVVWLLVRGKTTPLADPKDDSGVELVRKSDNQPPLQAQRYRSKRSPDTL